MALPSESQSSVAVSSATMTGSSSGKSNSRPELHALGFGGEPRQQRHGLEHLQGARDEMLPDHQRSEAARLGHPHLLDQVLELRPEVAPWRHCVAM